MEAPIPGSKYVVEDGDCLWLIAFLGSPMSNEERTKEERKEGREKYE